MAQGSLCSWKYVRKAGKGHVKGQQQWALPETQAPGNCPT